MNKNINKRIIFWILIVFLAIVIAVLLMFLKPKTAQSNVNNFEECVKAGYPVMETYPRQCKTPDGRMFIENTKIETCKNLCGDGVCQELVCMAIGCPCAESKESCPQDCKK